MDRGAAAVLTVACVETGNYLRRGVDYVTRLHAGVTRHLNEPHVFRLFTDELRWHWPLLQRTGIEITEIPKDPPGWWSKIRLFAPEAFRPGDRVLYLDLDTVIVGDLGPLARASGLLHLGRWGWTKNDYGSGVMAWRHGEHAEVFERFTRHVPRRLRGDQDWMTELGGWDALPDGICASYRYHCKNGPPAGVSVVCFHGTPKPHEFPTGWIADAWRI